MADTKVSALTAASAALAADEFPVNEAGASKKVTLAQVASLMFISGVYNPGTFSVPTGSYVSMISHLVLTSTARATFVGTSRLRID